MACYFKSSTKDTTTTICVINCIQLYEYKYNQNEVN